MLEAIGVAGRLEGEGCPINTIRVTDGLEAGGIVFDAAEGDDPLGIMFENRRLRAVLREAAEEAERVTLVMPASAADIVRDEAGVRVALADGRVLTAPLLVGAEGRNSPTRQAANIPVARW